MFDWFFCAEIWKHLLRDIICSSYSNAVLQLYVAYFCFMLRMGKAHFILRPKLHEPRLQTIEIITVNPENWNVDSYFLLVHIHAHKILNVLYVSFINHHQCDAIYQGCSTSCLFVFCCVNLSHHAVSWGPGSYPENCQGTPNLVLNLSCSVWCQQ